MDWIRRNGLVLFFPALVLAALFLPSDPEGMRVGDSVPAGAAVSLLDGETQDLVGVERPVVMEFWASWCSPCKKSVPSLNRIALDAGDRADLVAVNVEEHLSVEEVRARAQAFGYQFAVGKAPSSIQSDFSISHLPTLLVVYRGRVTYRHTGVVDEQGLAEHLKTLLAAPL